MERNRIKHATKIDFMLRKQLDFKVHADYKAKKSKEKNKSKREKEAGWGEGERKMRCAISDKRLVSRFL